MLKTEDDAVCKAILGATTANCQPPPTTQPAVLRTAFPQPVTTAPKTAHPPPGCVHRCYLEGQQCLQTGADEGLLQHAVAVGRREWVGDQVLLLRHTSEHICNEDRVQHTAFQEWTLQNRTVMLGGNGHVKEPDNACGDTPLLSPRGCTGMHLVQAIPSQPRVSENNMNGMPSMWV